MKNLGRRTLASTLLLGLIGCGSASDIEPGVPKDVDFSKNYAPAAAAGPIQPGKAKAKEAPAKPAAPAK